MRPILLAAVGVVLVLGLVAWLVLGSDDGAGATSTSYEAQSSEAEVARRDVELADASGPEPVARRGSLETATSQPAIEPAVAAGKEKEKIDTSLPGAPFEVRVVDERTGLPLPRYLVRFHDEAGRRVDAITGDDGLLTTSELAVGEVRARPLDHERSRQRNEPTVLKHKLVDERPGVVSVPSGPTYHVVLVPRGDPIGGDPDADDAFDPAQVDLRLQVAHDDDRSGTSIEALRTEAPYRLEGEPFWVRFPAMEPRFDRAESIMARTRDGLWWGNESVSTIRGTAQGILTIELDARAVLSGVVRCEGAPVRDATVDLRIEDRDGMRLSERATRTDGEGRYRFEFQRAGDARLRTRSLRHETAEDRVRLRAGAAVEHDVDLVALPTAGPIGGIVLSTSGTYEEDVHFTLTPAGERGRDLPRLRVKVAWTKNDGELRGYFSFGELPEGNYRLQLEEDDWFEWAPRTLVVEPPRADVVVRVQDDMLTADLVFDVRDADNGRVLDGFHLQLETYDGWRSFWSWSGAVALPAYPEDKRLRWRLDMPGYPPRFGDLSDFAVRTVVDKRARRTCEIEMTPGWGDQLRIVRRNNGRPLEGVEVVLDGRSAGTTGANGIAVVKARDKPERVELKREGWEIVGELDLRSPSKRGWNRYNTVRMQPAPKQKP